MLHPHQNTIRWPLLLPLSIFFVVAVNLWIYHTELFTGASNIAGGNPPVPVLLGLLLLTLLLRGPLRLTESELIAFYIFSVMSIIPTMSGGVRAFFPALTVPGYFAQPGDHLRDFWKVIPHWWVPKDMGVIKEFFEGSESGVPWAAWIFPLVFWSIFFSALLAFAWGLSLLLTPGWLAFERLNFPLAQLPLHIIRSNALFSPLTLTGIVLGALPTVMMIFYSLLRPITDNPVENFCWNLDFLLEGRPFDSLRPLRIYPHWHGIGIGYFVSQDILFSIWFFYGVLKLFALIGIGYRGLTLPDFPYPQPQSAGGYLFLGFFFLSRVFCGRWCKHKAFACGLLIIASGVVLAWMIFSGLSTTLAIAYWLMVMLFTTVYVRIRAEIGMPYTWVYPYGMQREILFLTLGVPANLRYLALLGGFFWLSRQFFLPLNATYAADAIKLIVKGDTIPSKLLMWGFTGGVVGLWVAFLTHLRAYYRRGANFLEGAPGTGDFRTLVTVQDYRWLSQLVDNPTLLRRGRLSWMVYGTVVNGVLLVLRRFWTSSPLHPLGSVLAGTYGHLCPYWFPCLVAWLVKGLILRYGGMKLYRKLIPLFLGIALGHYLTAGVLWAGCLRPLFRDRWPFPFRIGFD